MRDTLNIGQVSLSGTSDHLLLTCFPKDVQKHKICWKINTINIFHPGKNISQPPTKHFVISIQIPYINGIEQELRLFEKTCGNSFPWFSKIGFAGLNRFSTKFEVGGIYFRFMTWKYISLINVFFIFRDWKYKYIYCDIFSINSVFEHPWVFLCSWLRPKMFR